jgi:glycosyltransferase involved in cell wall biosynthesis
VKLVIQNMSRVWGGNEKWMATLAAGLMRRGHQVVVSCRADGAVPAELARRGIATTQVRPGMLGDAVRGVRFTRWLRAERPDALLLTSWKGMAWASWAARRAGVPRTVLRLGIVRRLPPRGRHTWAFRGGIHAMIVNAPEIAEAWRRSAPGFPQDAVHVVLNGVPAIPPLGEPDRAQLRAELGAGPGERLVAGVGHVERRKGFDLLLRAAAELSDVVPVIVGTGSAEGELRALATELGIADRVRWTGFRADAPRLIAACDLFALTSRNEGMANVMLEAMAVGTPVVAADVSGVRRAIGPTGDRPAAGWIVPPDDAPALRAALAAALADPSAARAGAAEARWRVEHWFGVERMVDECEAILFP